MNAVHKMKETMIGRMPICGSNWKLGTVIDNEVTCKRCLRALIYRLPTPAIKGKSHRKPKGI